MSGPWEDYQAQSGPWNDYASPSHPAVDPSIFAKGPLKIGKDAFGDTLRDTLKNTDWATRNIAGAGAALVSGLEGLGIGSPVVNALNTAKNFVTGSSLPTNTTRDRNIEAQKVIAEEAPIGNIAGNVAMLAPTALIPGANTVTGAATIGAIQGAALTPGDIAERAKAAVFGFGGGAAGAGLSRFASSTAPVVANPNAAALAREGIGLTPGQNAGGFLKSLEDKMTSAPFVGDIIQSARRRGIEDFNRAAFRRVADPLERAGIPVQSGDIGRQGMQALRQDLGAAYDDVLSRSSANALEPQFVQNMASLRQLASALPPREQAAFDAIIEREIGQRMAPNGMVNAENLQAAKSGLGQQVTNFSTANSGHERNLGMALKQADEEFRNLVARANPQNAADLKAIDTAYANFKRLQRAASGVGAKEGIFTPAQLNNAVKAMDKSKDKRAFSEGNALLQDLTDPAKAVMPSEIPDSGTVGRLLSDMTNPLRWPGLAANTAAALPVAMAYSRPGAAAINYGMNNGAIPATNALQRLLADNPNLSRLLGTVSPKLVSN